MTNNTNIYGVTDTQLYVSFTVVEVPTAVCKDLAK